MKTKRIGNFSISSGRVGVKDLFERLDRPRTNIRPSSSGSGRKLTKNQRERAGLDKEAQIDPRYFRYGVPALMGLLLGTGLKGLPYGLAGGVLGAGLGHQFLDEKGRKALANYLGVGAGVGPGSSADTSATTPSTSTPGLPLAQREELARAVRARAQQYVEAGVPIDASLEQATIDLNSGLEAAGQSWKSTIGGTPNDMFMSLMKNLTPAQQQAMLARPTAGISGALEMYDPRTYTKMLASGDPVQMGLGGVFGGMLGRELVGAAAPQGVRALLAGRAPLLAATGNFGRSVIRGAPSALAQGSAFIDLADIANRMSQAKGSLAERANIAGRSFGEDVLKDYFGPGSRKGTVGRAFGKTIGGVAAMPIAHAHLSASVGEGTNELRKNLARMGALSKDPRTGKYYNQDPQIEKLRKQLDTLERGNWSQRLYNYFF